MGALEISCIVVGVFIAVAIAVNVFLFVTRKKKRRYAYTAPVKKAPVYKAPEPVYEEDESVEEEEEELSYEEEPAEERAISELTVTDDTGDDDAYSELKAVVEDGKTRYIVIKYNKSFTAKLIQSDAQTKEYYSELKNYLLSFKKVKSRIGWRWESFHVGRQTVAKISLRGKTLSLCLALDAEDYNDTKYHVEDFSDVKSLESTPCLYRIKNDRRLTYAKQLIDTLMENGGVVRTESEVIDYYSQYPYETTKELIAKKLIKVLTDMDAQSGTVFMTNAVREKVSAQEVDEILKDEDATMLIERSDSPSDRTKTDIINIDTLSECFSAGERVTLEEIKKRVKGFNKRVTYIKVLARGTLDKPLTVEADNFSLQAVKMIVLTGGTAIRKG